MGSGMSKFAADQTVKYLAGVASGLIKQPPVQVGLVLVGASMIKKFVKEMRERETQEALGTNVEQIRTAVENLDAAVRDRLIAMEASEETIGEWDVRMTAVEVQLYRIEGNVELTLERIQELQNQLNDVQAHRVLGFAALLQAILNGAGAAAPDAADPDAAAPDAAAPDAAAHLQDQ